MWSIPVMDSKKGLKKSIQIHRGSYFVRHPGKVKSNSSSARCGPHPQVIMCINGVRNGLQTSLNRLFHG
jgi:hypothetical protein